MASARDGARTLKLWLLTRMDERVYDEYIEFLCRAETEDDARRLAFDLVTREQAEHDRYEDAEYDRHAEYDQIILLRRPPRERRQSAIWLDPTATKIRRVSERGARDARAAGRETLGSRAGFRGRAPVGLGEAP